MKPKINLHEGEKMLIECQPQKSLVLYLFFTTGFAIIIPVILAGLFFAFTHASQVDVLLRLAPFLLVLVIVAGLGYLWFSYMVDRRWYFFTNDRCIIYAGAWGINRKVFTYNRIIDVDMSRNPLRSLFGMSAVYLVQPGIGGLGSGNMSGGFLSVLLGIFMSSRSNRSSGGLLDSQYNRANVSANVTVLDGLTHELADKITDLVSQHMSRGS